MSHTSEILIANAAYRLKLTRLSRHQTLGDVAADTGMILSALSRLETGSHNAEIETWLILIEYYGLTVRQVFRDYTRKPLASQLKRLEAMSTALTRSRRWKEKKAKRKRKLKDVVV